MAVGTAEGSIASTDNGASVVVTVWPDAENVPQAPTNTSELFSLLSAIPFVYCTDWQLLGTAPVGNVIVIGCGLLFELISTALQSEPCL